jgi:nicotinamidase-related amidase
MVAQLILPDNIQVAPHAPLAYTPQFWDPRKAYVTYEPDVEGAFLEGMAYRKSQGKSFRTAGQLEQAGISNALMLTDLQHDFRSLGRLPVTGTDNVVLRVVTRLLNGIIADYYTRIIYSQDGHVPFHISYGSTWQMMRDSAPLDLRVHKAAVLNLVDRQRAIFQATAFAPDGTPVDLGEIRSLIEATDTVQYWDHLQTTGQGPIWVFANHCKLGTDGTNLHPLIAEALAFAEGARIMSPMPVNKGHIRGTDWFGPLEPCRPDPGHPQGSFQKPIFDQLVGVRGWSEFAGVAEDFCDFNMKKQVLKHLTDSDVFQRIAFLTDGTAPIVPNTQAVLDQNADARSKGVKFLAHDEPFVLVA